MFLSSGAFVKGTFKDGQLHGTCYMRPNNDFACLLKVADGVLEHKNSVFDFQSDTLRVLSYSDGKFMGEEKSIARNAERCHREIVMSLFGKEPGTVKFLTDLTQRIKTMPGQFVGSFVLDEKTWYFGGWSDGQPNGLGVLIESGLRVQIGYFEEGQLVSFGRCISKSGVVMDGTMKRGTMNDEVVLYNQSAHEYLQAIFKDNLLEEEVSKGEGYPREERQHLFAQRFLQAYDRKFKIAISPAILCPDVDHEELFSLVMGLPFNPHGLNNFKFRLSGSKWIDTDSRKDQEDTKQPTNITSRDSDPAPGTIKVPPVPLEALNRGPKQGAAQPGRGEGEDGRKGEQSQLQGSRHQPAPPAEFQTYGRSSDDESGLQGGRPDRHHKAAESGDWEELQGYGGEGEGFTLRNEKDLAYDHGRQPAPQFGQPSGYKEDKSEPDHYQKPSKQRDMNGSTSQLSAGPGPKKPSESQHPSMQFDKYDMMILQRSLNWESEKVLNPKNRFSRKAMSTVTGTKGVSEETRLNIIQNYIEDFMYNFLDKKAIDQLMSGVDGYQTIRNRVLQHCGGPGQH